MLKYVALVCVALSLPASVGAQEGKDTKENAEKNAKALAAARAKGLDYLTKNQAKDGSWGKTYTFAVTSFACLSYLSASDEPFADENGKTLIKGLNFLLASQKDGMFGSQGHSWIHGQGFATLAMSEAYGRSLTCKTKPDMDVKKLKDAVAKAVAIIAKNQSTTGGWWYTPGENQTQDEGSTTVLRVQALVSASNFKIPIDEKSLDKGFDYLKKCQTKQGGFNYRLGDGSNMKEGTCAAVATLGLMQKFDFTVMTNGYKFMLATTPEVIGRERFPYYGHFYGIMGMHLLAQEYKDDKSFRENTAKYIAAAQKDMLSWQAGDGSFPLKNFVNEGTETKSYSTAFALIGLQVVESRLSILNRDPPMLPGEK